jgi:Tfp pilus assembly protein PilF
VSNVRRNDPCPCGSGKRYKECHGRLGEASPGLDVVLQRALAAHQQGRIDEAEGGYRAALAQDPAHAIATHYLGLIAWQRGSVAEGERQMRAAIAANAAIPDFHNNLGLLLRDTRRTEEAIACFRTALTVDATWFEAHNNLGLALEAAGRWEEAIAAYREAISREPRFPAARQNLARALLAQGSYAEGWQEYRWRLLAHGIGSAAPDPAASPLPAALDGRRFVLRAEQGLGDILFFLRFAPELVRRGAKLAFQGEARLHSMLQRTGLFALGLEPHDTPRAAAGEGLHIGDLPWLLEANDPALFPPPLALLPEAERVARLTHALEAAGRKPWIALTWRGGVASAGPARTQVKEIDLETLGASLRGIDATWLSVQRMPRAGEREKLAEAIGAPVHDLSEANEDLEEMLALLAAASEYAGVSNANMHLRAALAGSMQVLVPNPPEWRWGVKGVRSPWFPTAAIHRQTPALEWSAAMTSLRAALHRR